MRSEAEQLKGFRVQLITFVPRLIFWGSLSVLVSSINAVLRLVPERDDVRLS